MLYILGLGLRGVSSLSLQEKDILSRCEHIFFETYTSVSPSQTIDQLSSMLNREVKRAGREEVENPVALLSLASRNDVCLLVTGDPLSATTHNQLRVDAHLAGINVEVIENASILSVIPGKLGLFPYRMGPPVSLPFPEDNFLPRSVCQKIKFNQDSGFQTMVLLDLREGRTMYSFEAVDVLRGWYDKRYRRLFKFKVENVFRTVPYYLLPILRHFYCSTYHAVSADGTNRVFLLHPQQNIHSLKGIHCSAFSQVK